MSAGHKSSGRGQALVLIVFGIVAVIGIAGLAIDGGSVYSDRRRAQNAVDSAAMAASLARINGQNWLDRGRSVSEENGYAGTDGRSTLELYSPPISGPYRGNIEYIQVRLTSNVRTPFAAVVGRPHMTNVVEAVARSKPAQYRPMFNGAAVVSLAATSDCDDHKAFWVHTEQTLSLEGGGVFVNSNNPTCALIQQASGSIRIDGAFPIEVVGGYRVSKPSLLTPFPPIKGKAVSYPPPFFMPEISCQGREARISEDGATMSPGTWGEPFPPKGVTALEKGIYCLEGDFIMEGGSLIGDDVLFYLPYGRLQIQGGVQLDLKAPDSGKYSGLLIYQPRENQNRLVLNAANESAVVGTILAPGAEIRIKGNDNRSGFHSQIIGYTINADGNSNVYVRYIDEENYDALHYPEVQFAQ